MARSCLIDANLVVKGGVEVSKAEKVLSEIENKIKKVKFCPLLGGIEGEF